MSDSFESITPLSLAAAAAAAAAFVYHARRSGAGPVLVLLRGASAAALILAVLRPTLALSEPARLRPRLLVLLDAGHAMGAGKPTRLATAGAWLLRARSALEARAEPALYALSNAARRLGWEELRALQPAEAGLHPSEALRELCLDPQARSERAWLLTDGNAEPDPQLEKALAALKVPVDVVGVGPQRRGRALVFVDIKTPDFAFLHARMPVEASLEASGLAGEALVLRLYKEGKPGSWTLVQENKVRPAGDFETLAASFTATAQALGPERYRLEALGPRGLAHAREFRVEVIRQKYRIMYLAGRPSPEYAYLRETLKADPNHELVSFVILRNPESPTPVPDSELSLIPFPAEEIFVQSLAQFDLFILENFSYARFRLPPSYLESLKGFVAGGGALLVIGGENAFGLGGYRGTALEELLPVALSPQVPDFLPGLFKAVPAAPGHPLARLYETPEESRAAWEALPELDGRARFAAVRPGATVLAVHPSERTDDGAPLPVLAIRDHGRGKVMLASSDSTWRWRLGAAADWKAAGFYGRFWTRAVQYLTGSLDLSKVKFAPLPDRLPPREPAALSLRVFDEGFRPAPPGAVELSVVWSGADGRPRAVLPRETAPGVYAVELTGLSPGPQKVRASARYRGKPWGEDTARFQWELAPADAPMDRRWMRRVAEATGGTVTEVSAARVEELLERLPAVRRGSLVRRRLQPWAEPAWLGLAVGLLLLEWALRRRRGLP